MELKEGYKQTEVGVIPEDWDGVKLAKVAEIDPENLSSSTNPEYQFQYISLEDVDYGCLRNRSETIFRVAPSRARRRIKKDDILFSTVRPNLKSHYLVTEDVSDWICSTGFSVIRCNSNQAEPKYIYNHLFAYAVNKQIDSLIAGSNYPAINSKDVKSFTIPLPPTKAEQITIATILSDMDAEIAALETKLAQYKQIKQGMMQELLTGKTRLI